MGQAILGLAVLLFGGGFLARGVAHARTSSWAGPRSKGMRQRAGSSAGNGLRPVRHEIKQVWAQARATDWLEERRHQRKNGAPVASVTDLGSHREARKMQAVVSGAARAVPGHETNPEGRIRRPVVKALQATGAWNLLPGRIQGGLCNCPVDRGEPQPAANGYAPAPPSRAGGNGHGTWAPGPVRATGPSLSPSRATANGSPGRTTTVATSTGSAEKLIEGVNQMHAEAAAGNIHAKHGAMKSCTEGSLRFSAMAATLSRTMSEPGMHYGPEITEPLAKASVHLQAAAMAFSEADSSLTTLLQMTLGDVASSGRQAPHHAELTESGSR